MKIIIVVGTFPKLSETFIVNDIVGLLNEGHEVDIVAFSRPAKGEKFQKEIYEYRLQEKVRYIRVPEGRLERFWLLAVIMLENLGPNLKVILKVLSAHGGDLYTKLNTVFKFRSFLKKRYDIIHCHFGVEAVRLHFIKKFLKVKFVTSFHGYDISKFVKDHGNDVYRELFLNGDLFLPVSDYFKKRLISLGCSESKVRIHYMGIRTEGFPFIDRPFQFSQNVRILSIGRLVAKKGFEYGIKAVAQMIQKYPQIQYTIVGEGEEEGRLKALISSLKAENHVRLLGQVVHDEVEALVAASDIVLVPSVTSDKGDEEGIPTALKEGMISGMPVVSTYHAGIPELVIDGENGFLVEQRDVQGLAQKLSHLVENPELCRKMGQAGRKRIIEKFELKQLSKELVDIYLSLLNGQSKSKGQGNAKSQRHYSHV